MNATELIRSYVSRIERLREEKAAITGDERDVFTEAKSNGLDCKALRKVLQRRAMGDAACAEMDAIVDAYEAALGAKAVAIEEMRRGASPRQAAKKAGIGEGTARRAKNLISGAPAHDPETGEITQSEAPPIRKDGEREGLGADVAAADATETASDTTSTTGSTLPPAGNDAHRSSSAAPSPVVETPTDDGIRRGSQEVAEPIPNSPVSSRLHPHADGADDADDGWQAKDAAGNYGTAYSAIRERHVASGQARLDPGLSRMSEAELVERAAAAKPAQPWRAT